MLHFWKIILLFCPFFLKINLSKKKLDWMTRTVLATSVLPLFFEQLGWMLFLLFLYYFCLLVVRQYQTYRLTNLYLMRNEKQLDMHRFRNLSSLCETFNQGNQQFVLVQTLIWFSYAGIKPTSSHSWSSTFDKEVQIRLKTFMEIVPTASVSGFLELTKKSQCNDFSGKLIWTRKRNYHGCLFFVSSICVAMLS